MAGNQIRNNTRNESILAVIRLCSGLLPSKLAPLIEGRVETHFTRTVYTGLISVVYCLLSGKPNVTFNDEIVPPVVLKYGDRLFTLCVKPDVFGTDASRRLLLASIEEKVKPQNYTENINKAIFLSLLQWKQTQMLLGEEKASKFVVPSIVIHGDKVLIYFFASLKDKDWDSEGPNFGYCKVLEFDLKKEEDCLQARIVVYNFFMFFESVREDYEKITDYGKITKLQLERFTKTAAASHNSLIHPLTDAQPSNIGTQGEDEFEMQEAELNDLHVCDALGLRYEENLLEDETLLPVFNKVDERSHGVLKAIDESNRVVVVKYALTDDEERTKRLKGEIEMLQKISNLSVRNFSRLLKFGMEENDLKFNYFTGTFVGKPLSVIKELKLSSWMKLARSIVACVLSLHKAGFIHSDLSLRNVCVDDCDEVSLIDFKLAIPCDSNGLSLQPVGSGALKDLLRLKCCY
jgi:hypothetical protein